MKRATALFCLLLLLAVQACGNAKPGDQLAGTWRCDGRATFGLMPESGGMSRQQLTAGIGVLENMSLKIDSAAGSLKLSIGSSVEEFSYTVQEEKGNVFTLALGGGTAQAELKNRDTLLLTDFRTPERTVVFTRQK